MSKGRNMVLLLASLAITLALTEAGLRIAGFRPGYTLRIELLLLLDEFSNDQDGIMKVSRRKVEWVHDIVGSKEFEKFIEKDPNDASDNVDRVLIEFNKKTDEDEQSEFSRFVNGLKAKNNLDEVEKAYMDYSRVPINSDGFRSIEFKNYETQKPKLLLLGDSFTWGERARPVTYSFADILAARGYVCFNTGIPGTDPAQYLAIAEKYIPLIKPDVVIVNFFMGNDQMDFKREVSSSKPVFYTTNAGALNAYYKGNFISYQQAYDLYMNQFYIIPENANTLNKWCAKTVISTLVWSLFHERENSATDFRFHEGVTLPNKETGGPYSEFYTDGIRRICELNGARFVLSLIPYNANPDKEQARLNFPNTDYHMITTGKEDYSSVDDHFNNRGMKKYADFLQVLVDSSIAKK